MTGTINDRVGLGDPAAFDLKWTKIPFKSFTPRATVTIGHRIKLKVGSTEGTICAFTLLPYRDMGRNAFVLGLDLQYNFWRSNYLVLRSNTGITSWEPEDLLLFESAFSGLGLTLGNMSLIGPVEFTIMRSNLRAETLFYINIGYYF